MRDASDKTLPPNYAKGIPIGVYDKDDTGRPRYMIYNHLDITVLTHTTIEGHYRIVGFEVEPFSMGEQPERQKNDPNLSPEPQYLKAGEEFRFSYRMISRVRTF